MEFLQALDRAFFHLINISLSNPFLDVFFPTITDLHKTYIFRIIFIPFLFILWVSLYKLRGFIIFVLLAVSLGISDLIGGIAKRFVMRPRPFEADIEFIQRSAAGGYSFPSNHAVNMFCAAVFLSAAFPRWRVPLFIFASLVALSRVYNGVHYPSDILGGGLLGASVGFIASRLAMQINEWIEDGMPRRRWR